MGFLLGCGAALCLGTVLSLATRPSAARSGAAGAPRVLQVYPSGRQLGTAVPLDEPSRLRFLPGVAGEGSRADGLEAILRLHTYLAMRDVHGGPVELLWRPAVAWEEDEEVLRDVCAPPAALNPGEPEAGWLLTGVRRDPLGRELDPERDFGVLLRAESDDGELRVDAVACTASGSKRSEVFVAGSGGEGVILRELCSWLAAIVGVADPGEFEDHWGREPAPRGPALSTYGELLARSLDPGGESPRLPDRPPDSTLEEATSIVPEAAWLAAALAADPAERRRLLRRAVALRVGFTAALEDLTWEQLADGRPELATATLARLSDDDARLRPVELHMAAGLLAGGRPGDCRTLLAGLPRRWRATTATARLHALALVRLGNPAEAVRWASSWADGDPESAEALVVLGRALAAADRLDEAGVAWRRAARLDSRWRRQAVSAWLAAALEVGRAAEVRGFLDELEKDGGLLTPEVREVRAYAALRAGDPVAALGDYQVLSELRPDVPRLGLNRCISALLAGRQDPAEHCHEQARTRLEELQLRTAAESREVILPGVPRDTRREVRALAELAPANPEVAQAVMLVFGTSRNSSREERQLALARWRVAVGAGVIAPELPELEDGEQPLP